MKQITYLLNLLNSWHGKMISIIIIGATQLKVLNLIRTTKNFPSFLCQTLEFWKHHKFPRVVCSTEYWNDSDMPLWKLFFRPNSFCTDNTVWAELTSEFAAHKNRPGKKTKRKGKEREIELKREYYVVLVLILDIISIFFEAAWFL